MELAVLVIVGIAVTRLSTGTLYPRLGLPSKGPVPLRTVALVLAILWLLWKGGERWTDFGLHWRSSWWKLAGWVLVVLVVKLLVAAPVSEAIGRALRVEPPDYSFFTHIQGNVWSLVLWLCVAWGVGGFGEEFVLRGYLMRRIASLAGEGRLAWTVALVTQAVVFGVAHAYVGASGAISTTASALVYGSVVLMADKSIWPVMIAHGLWDSFGFVLVFFQGLPGS